jgi:hypothetical protein
MRCSNRERGLNFELLMQTAGRGAETAASTHAVLIFAASATGALSSRFDTGRFLISAVRVTDLLQAILVDFVG